MVRLFHVYYPTRTLVLVAGEASLICGSFLLATLVCFGPSGFYPVLSSEAGFYKIAAITGAALLCLYYFDLYDFQLVQRPVEAYVRLFAGLGILSLLLAAFGYLFPRFMLGRQVYMASLLMLTIVLLGWRTLYSWMIRQPFLRERVYVLGTGPRASRLVSMLRARTDLGMEVVGWAGAIGNGSLTREALANSLTALKSNHSLDRVIVAMSDRRNLMPVQELLDLRMSGIKVEDSTALQEELTGRIGVEELNPSWLVFGEGFRLHRGLLLVQRGFSIAVALINLLLVLPLFPPIALAIKLTSPGPVLYRQKRVGRNGITFDCYKFRTMRTDAEAGTGPVWAGDRDLRVTSAGRFLRRVRLDEIPQLWNVLRGDMSFVGPRPERPEFVEWLSREIPYYSLRHLVLPGITGWAQVNYSYGASLEESKEKLCYDLYYIKNMSLSFDLVILFRTVKIVLLGRGSR